MLNAKRPSPSQPTAAPLPPFRRGAYLPSESVPSLGMCCTDEGSLSLVEMRARRLGPDGLTLGVVPVGDIAVGAGRDGDVLARHRVGN